MTARAASGNVLASRLFPHGGYRHSISVSSIPIKPFFSLLPLGSYWKIPNCSVPRRRLPIPSPFHHLLWNLYKPGALGLPCGRKCIVSMDEWQKRLIRLDKHPSAHAGHTDTAAFPSTYPFHCCNAGTREPAFLHGKTRQFF